MHLFLTSLAISWVPPVKSPGTSHWEKGHQVVKSRCGEAGGQGVPKSAGRAGGWGRLERGPWETCGIEVGPSCQCCPLTGCCGTDQQEQKQMCFWSPGTGAGGVGALSGTQQRHLEKPTKVSVSRCPETDNALVKQQLFFFFFFTEIYSHPYLFLITFKDTILEDEEEKH